MKAMVQVLIQPRWSEWRQNSALRSARRLFHGEIWRLENDRWARGLPGFQKSKLLEYREVADWVSDLYIELRGEYRIRIDYAEFCRILTRHDEIGDEWLIYRRSGWGAAGCPYRQGWSYVRNEDHKPKDRPTDNAWHTETKHKRDKARRRRHRNGARCFWVKQSARDHRAWVKREIARENWDLFDRGAQDQEYQQFADPWLWD